MEFILFRVKMFRIISLFKCTNKLWNLFCLLSALSYTYNLHTIKFTKFKYTGQWVLTNASSGVTTTSGYRTFLSFHKVPFCPSVVHLFPQAWPLAVTNLLSVCIAMALFQTITENQGTWSSRLTLVSKSIQGRNVLWGGSFFVLVENQFPGNWTH